MEGTRSSAAMVLTQLAWNMLVLAPEVLDTMRFDQNDCHFADNICECVSLNENVYISIRTALKCIPEVLIAVNIGSSNV